MLVNPFQQQGQWYRANLHAHTTASDGQATAHERIQQYRAEGYAALAITDHAVSSDVSGFSADDFVLIDGIEVTIVPLGEERGIHLVCLNVPPDATVPATNEPNDVIAWAREEGGETFIGHPYWSGNTAEELLELHGAIGVEVYNAACDTIGKAHSTVHWDNMLDRGARLPGLAVDDAHSGPEGGRDLFAGWVMFKLAELNAPAVMEALLKGCYYSSSGPRIEDFRLDDGHVVLRCSEAAEIRLIGANWHGWSLFADGGEPLSEARAPVTRDWKYARALVVAPDGRRAWTNPLFL